MNYDAGAVAGFLLICLLLVMTFRAEWLANIAKVLLILFALAFSLAGPVCVIMFLLYLWRL